MAYAEVAVNSPVGQSRLFTYSIPEGMELEPGHAVWVPFGSQTLQGIVFALSELSEVWPTREVAALAAPRPLLGHVQIELARWISDYYLAPLFASAALFAPPGFERQTLNLLVAVADSPSPEGLTAAQEAVLDLVRRRGRIAVEEVHRLYGEKEGASIVAHLVRRGLLRRMRELRPPRVRPKMVAWLRLAVGSEEARTKVRALREKEAPRPVDLRRAALLEAAVEAPGGAPRAVLLAASGANAVDARALVKAGLLRLESRRDRRDPLAHRPPRPAQPPVLTPAQEAVWHQVRSALLSEVEGHPPRKGAASVFLLHGVTGSGKTEVYLRALAETVAARRRGIVLVPEIALTPQTVDRFAARFPGRVAVLHSKLSLGEQFDEWEGIRDGEFDVVVGSRSAVFAPQPELGLIVVDEEHEWTYKQQEQPPRYHAREVAIEMARRMAGVVVLLGSATPELGTYHRAKLGEFRLLELPERVSGSAVASGEQAEASEPRPSVMPQVQVVDLRRELKEGNRSIFSRALRGALSAALAAGEQAILFLNRRGSAAFVQCRDCGHVLTCPRCDLSLTYHTRPEGLACHQCNYHTMLPSHCPECFSPRIRSLGVGTEAVEKAVKELHPQARTLRWDRDVTGGRYAHEEILDRFVAHEADVLVGTQMVAKGLDLPQVTLVGVLNADIGLHFPDYVSSERAFQVLTQVAGRAGRGPSGGRVIIQTYSPHHFAITAAANHDYAAFYEKESRFRRERRYPPFGRLTRLLYQHVNVAAGEREAARFALALRHRRDELGLPDIDVLGPVPALTRRLRGRYRWQVVLRGRETQALLSAIALPRGWTVDVDPVSLA